MEFSSIRSRSNRTDHGMRFYKWFIDWFACFSALIINHSVFEIIRTPLFSQQRQPSARQTINSCVRQNVQIKNQFQLELFIVNIDRAIDRQTLLLFTFNALLLWFWCIFKSIAKSRMCAMRYSISWNDSYNYRSFTKFLSARHSTQCGPTIYRLEYHGFQTVKFDYFSFFLIEMDRWRM